MDFCVKDGLVVSLGDTGGCVSSVAAAAAVPEGETDFDGDDIEKMLFCFNRSFSSRSLGRKRLVAYENEY